MVPKADLVGQLAAVADRQTATTALISEDGAVSYGDVLAAIRTPSANEVGLGRSTGQRRLLAMLSALAEGHDFDMHLGVAQTPLDRVGTNGDTRPGPGVVVRSSGTTGERKGTRIPIEDLLRTAVGLRALERRLLVPSSLGEAADVGGALWACRAKLRTPLRRHLCWMCPFDVDTVSGLLLSLMALLSGHTLVLLDEFQPRVCLELMQRYRVNYVGLTPEMARLVLRAAQRKEYDLQSLAIVGLGGEMPDTRVVRDLRKRFGTLVLTGYGAAELHGPVLVGLGSTSWQRINVGRPVGSRTVRVAGASADHARGELHVRNDGEMDWRHAGDVARQVGRQRYQILGRTADEVRSSNQEVAYWHLEEQCRNLPGVSDCALVSDGASSPAIAVFLECDERRDPGMSRAAEGILRSHGGVQDAVDIRIVSQLPRTPDGKVRRAVLRDASRSS